MDGYEHPWPPVGCQPAATYYRIDPYRFESITQKIIVLLELCVACGRTMMFERGTNCAIINSLASATRAHGS